MDREKLREDLRECPICNGNAIIEQTGKKQITIKCKNCQLKKVQKHLHYSFEWLWNKMVDDWNKRISDEKIKELEEVVKKSRSAFNILTNDGLDLQKYVDMCDKGLQG